jgi:hypothetical protein
VSVLDEPISDIELSSTCTQQLLPLFAVVTSINTFARGASSGLWRGTDRRWQGAEWLPAVWEFKADSSVDIATDANCGVGSYLYVPRWTRRGSREVYVFVNPSRVGLY